MKNKTIVFLVFILSHLNLIGQDSIKRLNFILLIDDKIPKATISDGYFLIKDSTKAIIAKLPFKYQVGELEMDSAGYNILLTKIPKSEKIIRFTSLERNSRKQYEYSIWANETYIILHIYNRDKKANYEKFDFGDKEYIILMETPLLSTVIPYRKKWYRKYKSDLN